MSVLWPSKYANPYPTPLGTDLPSALAMHPPEVQPDLRMFLTENNWNQSGVHTERMERDCQCTRSERREVNFLPCFMTVLYAQWETGSQSHGTYMN